MKFADAYGWLSTTFGMGGFCGVVANFIDGGRKQAVETLHQHIDRLTLRVSSLEKDHRDCIDSHAVQQFKLGRLEGELTALKNRVDNGQAKAP